MAMVVVDDSCLQADSQPKSRGLVWGSAAAWRCSTFIKWTEWPCGHDDSTINIVMVISIIIIIISSRFTHQACIISLFQEVAVNFPPG